MTAISDPVAEQRLAALAAANVVRSRRAAAKRKLAGGEVRLAQVLAEAPEQFRDCYIGELLRSAPFVGQTKAGRLLERLRISERARLDELSPRQRLTLLLELRRRHPRLWERCR